MKITNANAFFLGNNAALDFTNTQIIQRGEAVDLLHEPVDLAHWVQQTGRSLQDQPSKKELVGAKKLRQALKDLFLSTIDGGRVPEDSLNVINQHLDNHAVREILNLNARDELELIADETSASLTAVLAEIAYEGAKLLASSQASQIKRCNNPECVLLFLDISRSKKRRWCSMDTCGNRAKVARHYHGLNS